MSTPGKGDRWARSNNINTTGWAWLVILSPRRKTGGPIHEFCDISMGPSTYFVKSIGPMAALGIKPDGPIQKFCNIEGPSAYLQHRGGPINIFATLVGPISIFATSVGPINIFATSVGPINIFCVKTDGPIRNFCNIGRAHQHICNIEGPSTIFATSAGPIAAHGIRWMGPSKNFAHQGGHINIFATLVGPINNFCNIGRAHRRTWYQADGPIQNFCILRSDGPINKFHNIGMSPRADGPMVIFGILVDRTHKLSDGPLRKAACLHERSQKDIGWAKLVNALKKCITTSGDKTESDACLGYIGALQIQIYKYIHPSIHPSIPALWMQPLDDLEGIAALNTSIRLLVIELRANTMLTEKDARDFIEFTAETQFISCGCKHLVTPRVHRRSEKSTTGAIVKILKPQHIPQIIYLSIPAIFFNIIISKIITTEMSASETANDALNATLAAVQSLMRHCAKIVQGDPEALKLSDEIARHVAKDLKQYGADATSFSPKLLSCAAVVQQCSKAGTFETVLDWTTVSDQDLRIKSHPRFQKMVDYSSPNEGSPGKQPRPVAEEDDEKSETTTADIRPTLLTPLTPAFVSPSPPAPKHNLFVPGHVKRKSANDNAKPQELAPKRKKQEASAQKPKEEASGSAGQNSVCNIADEGFWDTDTKHSVHHHAWKCDKCKKLGMPCLILPNRKVGCTRLACANCDAMKIACAIDGVSVWKRMQAAKGLETATVPVKRSKSRAHKPQVVKIAPDGKQLHPAYCLASTHTPLEQLQPPATQTGELEPTASNILQGIQDLSMRFDLLATGERVHALEARVGAAEETWGKQLAALEQCLNASEEQHRAMSLTLDKLSMFLQDHTTYGTAHRASAAEQSGPPRISGWEADSIASSRPSSLTKREMCAMLRSSAGQNIQLTELLTGCQLQSSLARRISRVGRLIQLPLPDPQAQSKGSKDLRQRYIIEVELGQYNQTFCLANSMPEA
ncbi:hypothetical protein BDR05DRAFT_949562 [Suillus weaverae]|nr:hypothetical protein BDR05DRAFT_949562 [Suillus weaverae]